MNTEAIAAKLEDQLLASGRLASSDPAVEQVVDALVTALGPAIRQAALELVEQAAAEIGAQLTTGQVDVVLSDGEPSLVVGLAARGLAAVKRVGVVGRQPLLDMGRLLTTCKRQEQ